MFTYYYGDNGFVITYYYIHYYVLLHLLLNHYYLLLPFHYYYYAVIMGSLLLIITRSIIGNSGSLLPIIDWGNLGMVVLLHEARPCLQLSRARDAACRSVEDQLSFAVGAVRAERSVG